MKLTFNLCAIALFFLSVFNSCTYNKEKVLYPPKPDCDTIAVSFKNTIKPMIDAHCTNSGCHVAGTPIVGNFTLETYKDISREALDINNGQSVLYGAVAQLALFSPMPKGGTKLIDCDIKKLKAWINQGAKNN